MTWSDWTPGVRRRVLRRLVWLGEQAEQVIHHRLANLPSDLAGLCRLRVGDYRILYWHEVGDETIRVYRIQHRSEVYRNLE